MAAFLNHSSFGPVGGYVLNNRASMRSRVYVTVGCPSVCPSVCPSMAADIDRLLHGAQQRGVRRANAGSATLSAYVVAEHRLVCCFRQHEM